jgi:hypothetical protein
MAYAVASAVACSLRSASTVSAMSSRDVDSALERRRSSPKFTPSTPDSTIAWAQHALAASEPHAPFGAEGSGHLDDISACPVLTLITQGNRARTGGENEAGDEYDREATASAHGGDFSRQRMAGRGADTQLRAGTPSVAV